MSFAAYAAVAQSLLRQPPADAADTAGEEAEAPPPPSHEVHVPEIAERLQRTFAEEAVSRVVIHADKPIENVPAMLSSELTLIGRCVSFGMKQTINGITSVYYYTGLVSTVTATAVSLLCVNRYTEADFKAYKEREKKVSAAAATETQDFPEEDCSILTLVLAAEEARASARRSAPVHDDASRFSYSLSDVLRGAFGGSPRVSADVRGSLSPAVTMVTGEELERLSPHHTPHGVAEGARRGGTNDAAVAQPRPANFRACGDSAGPLPCATFLRKSLHDVAFGRAPDSSFYALLHDAAKRVMDMQYLRMFVRRYLVHASEGHTPMKLSLHRYVVKSSACGELDRDLAETVAREELLALLAHDRAILKEKRRMRTRAARREEAIQAYRAPPGIFSGTGFLYLTGLPQGSLLTAAAMLFFTSAFALNFILNVQVFGEGLLQRLFNEVSDYFMAAIGIWTVTCLVTIYHSLIMRAPTLANAPVLIVRGLCTAGSAIYAIICMAVISHSASNEYVNIGMQQSPSNTLCAFYEQHQCSGFYFACVNYAKKDPLCAACGPVRYPTKSCYTPVMEQLQRVMIPSFLFAVVIFLAAVHSLFLLLRLCLVARSMTLTSGA